MTEEDFKTIKDTKKKIDRKPKVNRNIKEKHENLNKEQKTTRRNNFNRKNTKNSVNSKIEKVEKTEKTEKRKETKVIKRDSIFKKSNLKIIPLGGLHEVGKNITVFEYEDEIIVVDCGLSFPEDDMLGIDLVIPDITYLIRNKDKIKGLVITHGHEDHIGAIPYILKQINVPIYATKLTAGLISNKLEEHKLLRGTKLKIVNQGETIKLGKNFKVEFIRSSHSIPDSVF